MSLPLSGKVSLITGASRGIGATVAVKLALSGADLAVNYRSKGARAEQVCKEVINLGGKAIAVQADLTIGSELDAMMSIIQQVYKRLDVLILNASGGLEKGKADDYAMTLNHTAQLRTARAAAKLMLEGGRIVFVTSHWAHFYNQKPVNAGYEVVAKSKYAGEQALREYTSELRSDISLVVVSGDVIEGTITPRLLERKNPGLIENRRLQAHKLPTIEEFADAIVDAATDRSLPPGHTILVGSTDY